ncbi:5-(carboxyamino)imidazole ribonucleotide synthase [Polycladidibacter stylochi]|uniref:5-(carboxyamino)imidazole ribonucleotide synthase n=1 Tax=Polycladidibacter stylochi TaxID=1807766 RepID=UPI00082C90FA|nr:5-(carboxyamino)imidazole ribonucleotide synthase [Pseudovibrio stylochi]
MSAILKPGETIGILGGGQLGRMIATAAARLGLKTHIFCPDVDSPAFDVATLTTIANYDDQDALEAFADQVSVVTYEFENVPFETAEFLQARVPVRPGSKALKVSQDRLTEKQFLLTRAGVATAPFADVTSLPDLNESLTRFGGKGVLKTRRFGYDGKGQVMIHSVDEAQSALAALGNQPAILEGLIEFDKEISVIVARSLDGRISCYDPTENYHRNHILKTSSVPANIDSDCAQKAKRMAETIATSLDYIGVMGVEFFVVDGDGQQSLLVNEIAPRVHNSGHWTEDACITSQFEQHARAVAGWSLASATRHSNVIMENLIGDDAKSWKSILQEENAKLTLYGKAEIRDGRKMGHVNRLSPLS